MCTLSEIFTPHIITNIIGPSPTNESYKETSKKDGKEKGKKTRQFKKILCTKTTFIEAKVSNPRTYFFFL